MIYRHKSGKLYLKLFETFSSDFMPEKRVIYMQLYKGSDFPMFTIWDRSKKEFLSKSEFVNYTGRFRTCGVVHRFKKLSLREIFLLIIGSGEYVTNTEITYKDNK